MRLTAGCFDRLNMTIRRIPNMPCHSERKRRISWKRNGTICTSFHIIPLPRDCHACARNDNRGLLRQTASGASHQADNLAKLRSEFLPLLELRAQILCAVSRAINLARLSALLACKRCRCLCDGFCSFCVFYRIFKFD